MTENDKVMVVVDSKRCVGSGWCAHEAPDHIEVVNGLAHPVPGPVVATEALHEAVDVCPTSAISLTELPDADA